MIPEVGEVVFIQSERFTGEAVVTYIDHPSIFNHHQFPIQVEVSEGDLHQFEDFNHGQTMHRTNLKEIIGVNQQEKIEKEGQLNLFDDF